MVTEVDRGFLDVTCVNSFNHSEVISWRISLTDPGDLVMVTTSLRGGAIGAGPLVPQRHSLGGIHEEKKGIPSRPLAIVGGDGFGFDRSRVLERGSVVGWFG